MTFEQSRTDFEQTIERNGLKAAFPGAGKNYLGENGYRVLPEGMMLYRVQDNMGHHFSVGKNYVVTVQRDYPLHRMLIPFLNLGFPKSMYGNVVAIESIEKRCEVPIFDPSAFPKEK